MSEVSNTESRSSYLKSIDTGIDKLSYAGDADHGLSDARLSAKSPAKLASGLRVAGGAGRVASVYGYARSTIDYGTNLWNANSLTDGVKATGDYAREISTGMLSSVAAGAAGAAAIAAGGTALAVGGAAVAAGVAVGVGAYYGFELIEGGMRNIRNWWYQ